ncbi:hypothetical protein ACN28S_19420 [Cystobacter fuscus]
MQQAFSPSHVTTGVLDELTFGVPLGFYYRRRGQAGACLPSHGANTSRPRAS